MLAKAPTIFELAERIRTIVGAELVKLEQTAAKAPLTESDTRRLRELANALRQAAVAAPSKKGRGDWSLRVPASLRASLDVGSNRMPAKEQR